MAAITPVDDTHFGTKSPEPEAFQTRILIVDDEEKLTKLMAVHLEKQGHTVQTINTGRGAFEAAKAFKPGLVILDVMLGDGAGYQVSRRMRKDPELYAVPILFMSSLGDQPEVDYAFSQGADGYLTKPFTLEDLNEKLRYMRQLQEDISTLSTMTKLPSIEAMKKEIDHRLFRKEGFAVCCVQLDGLNEFRERRGERGVQTALGFMSSLLVHHLNAMGTHEHYLCHMNGEYFLVLVKLDDYKRFSTSLVDQFHVHRRKLYTESELAREELLASGKADGSNQVSILMNLRVSVVHTRFRKFTHAQQMLNALKETHQLTKGFAKSVIFVDRKQV